MGDHDQSWSAPNENGNPDGFRTIRLGPSGAESLRSPKSRCYQTLRRSKLLLLASTVLGGVLGFAVILPQIRIYQARITIEVAGINESFLNFRQSDPVAFPGSGGDATDIQTQITILKSDSLRARVLTKLAHRR